jgi:hypothetical protein
VAAGPKIESAPIDIYGLIFKISLNYITYGAVNDPTTPFLNKINVFEIPPKIVFLYPDL